MRSEAREAAYKIVFAHLLGGDCTRGARSAQEELMAQISAHVIRYADYRIYPADRTALLIAVAEIDHFGVPPAVAASEAARLAGKYSTENSADFVNGVLGGIINQ